MPNTILRTLIFVLLTAATPAIADEPDWGGYASLLERYTSEGRKFGKELVLVDYGSLAQSEEFAELVDAVRRFDVSRLSSREERLAFYINAYNILTIQLILDHRPVESIRDIGNFLRGPWDLVMLENADGRLTLDDIEHKIIRPMGEARIHFAVNCASISCPDLRREPYTAEALEAQLEAQTRKFLGQQGKGIEVRDGTAHLSRLLDWYEEDFEDAGGVEKFVRKYAQVIDFKDIDADQDYDWRLNGKRK